MRKNIFTRYLLAFIALLFVGGGTNSLKAETKVIQWTVDSKALPKGGEPFDVKDKNAIQAAFGNVSDWKAGGSNAVTITVEGKKYEFSKTGITTETTNGKDDKTELAADGSSAFNYIGFVPHYDGELMVVIQKAGTNKKLKVRENGDTMEGEITLIKSGTSDSDKISWENVTVLDEQKAFDGAVCIPVKAGSEYTISLGGSKAIWNGFLFIYDGEAAVPASYTVREVSEDGGIVFNETTDDGYTDNEVKVPYHNYNVDNGQLYKKGATTSSEFNHKFTLMEDGQVETLEYTAVDGVDNVVFLSEGEDIETLTLCEGGDAANSLIRSSNSAAAYAEEDAVITTLPAGAYKLHAVIFDSSKTPDSHWVFKAGDVEIADLHCTKINYQEIASETFFLGEESEIIMAKSGSNKMGLDLIYITEETDAVIPTPVISSSYSFKNKTSKVTITAINGVTLMVSTDEGETWTSESSPFEAEVTETTTYLAYAKMSGYTDSEIAEMEIIADFDSTKPNIAWVYTKGYNSYSFADDPMVKALQADYNVVEVNYAKETTPSEDLKNADLIINSEAMNGGGTMANGMKVFVGEVPMINLKLFNYSTGRWEWGEPKNPKSDQGVLGFIPENTNYKVLKGVTYEADSLTINLATSDDTNVVQGVSFNSNALAGNVEMGSVVAEDGSSYTVMHASTEKKFFGLGLSADCMESYTDNASIIVKNAAAMLIAGEDLTAEATDEPLDTCAVPTVTIGGFSFAKKGYEVTFAVAEGDTVSVLNVSTDGKTFEKQTSPYVTVADSTTTYYVKAVAEGMVESAVVDTTVTVGYDNKKAYIAYVYDKSYSSGVVFAEDKIVKALQADYNVVEVACPVDSVPAEDWANADLIISTEAMAGNKPLSNGMKTFVGKAPMIALKAYNYNSGRWSWGTPANPSPAALGFTPKNGTYKVLEGVTAEEDGTIQVATETSSNAIQTVSFDGTDAPEDIVVMGTVGGEDTAAAMYASNAQKFFGLGLSSDCWKNYTDNPGIIIKNVAAILIAGGDLTEAEVADAISTVNAETANGTVYNLQGQKVTKAQKGLYIIGGKKVVVK